MTDEAKTRVKELLNYSIGRIQGMGEIDEELRLSLVKTERNLEEVLKIVDGSLGKTMKRICESCEDEIDENIRFQSDDYEIFEAVMVDMANRNVCAECALTKACIQQSRKENF